jgi:hypothetical protein
MTHVIDSVEAILRRPHGCAEQTISSVYPGLLILALTAGNPENPPPVAEKARRYLQAGYERLLNYQENDGGFSYWGHGHPDLALTAYALRFLTEAQPFIAVDDGVIEAARRWIESKQDKNGSWPVYSWDRQIDAAKTISTTAYIATVLSRLGAGRRPGNDTSQGKPGTKALSAALNYLSAKIEETDEPYPIAAYALAAFDAGEPDRAGPAVARLVSLAREERGASYWTLETNTPFFGWGLPGRIEASALAVRALSRAAEIGAQRESSPGRGGAVTGVGGDLNAGKPPNMERIRGLIDSGFIFLLRHKDNYGVWYSTQATINVLDTLVSELQAERRQAAAKAAETQAGHPDASRPSEYFEVYVNGKKSGTAALAAASFYENPVTVELGSSLRQGDNHIEIRRFGARSRATAQLVASFYQPWIDFPDSTTTAGPNRVLKLSVQFDKTRARVDDEITCTVEAERIGFQGYGMLVGEIGLPPGAEVDRESLDKALAANSGVDQYDILPDRLLVYLWPEAGGTKFQFKFRPRFGMNALTQPSLLYDYYNPEAEAFQPPARFIVAPN